jgi:hypothetical protein
MKKIASISLFLLLALLIRSGTAMATSGLLRTWQGIYSGSLSDDNVINGTGRGCQLCHQAVNGGNNWNVYGWDMKLQLDAGRSDSAAILDIEAIDSDLDSTGSTNLEEITADTQPGWTDGPNNTIYFANGSTLINQNPPANILGNLDPSTTAEADINLNPASLDFGTVTNGGSRNLTTQVQNLGTADLEVSVINRCMAAPGI